MKKLFGVLMLLLLVGCKGAKQVAYFQDVHPGSVTSIAYDSELRVQPGDKLTINVHSSEEELSKLFSLTSVAGGSSNRVIPYTVDKNGEINFPVLGKVKIVGMNRIEIAAAIEQLLKEQDLCRDAIVTAEFDNLFVDVLGEVNGAGRYQLTHDRTTILDVLSMAGDLNIQGKRSNVKVMRKVGESIQTYELNLDSLTALTQSPVYYMKQGDIVYVEPNNIKKRQTSVNGNNLLSVGFWMSAASFLMSIILMITK